MKLSPESISNLDKLLSTCAIVDIDAIIIEEGTVRGVNEDKSCVIISSVGVPELPEGLKMGLSRLGTLNARIGLFKNDPQTVIDMKENERQEITSLEISSPSAKVQFRCTSTALIKAPKKINDTVKFTLEIDRDQVPLILAGAKSMGAKKAVIASKKDGTFFEFTDTNQDTFSIRVGESMDQVFAHHYLAGVFLPLLRAVINNEGAILLNIGEIGTLNITVNGYPLTVLPQVQE